MEIKTLSIFINVPYREKKANVRIDDQRQMALIAKGYFEDLFTSSRGLVDMSHILSGVNQCILIEDNLEL